MFPYVCLATMPLFCRVDWPRKLEQYFGLKQKILSINANSIDANSVKETDQAKESAKPNNLKLPSNEIFYNKTVHEGEKNIFFAIIIQYKFKISTTIFRKSNEQGKRQKVFC